LERRSFDKAIVAIRLPVGLTKRSFALVVVLFTAAACGSDNDSPTAPSRTGSEAALQSLTVVGSSPGGVVLHRDETATGTVTLTRSAPAGGAAIALTVEGAESRLLIVAASVTIPAGSSSTTFPVMLAGSGVSAPTEVTLSAMYRNARQSFVIRLEPLR
jgi:hypothetical protein